MNKCLFLRGSLKVSPPPVQHFFPFGSESSFRSARFDDADSSQSLRSNYSCPVKYHNAPKDQFTAWGALSCPLKPQFQPLWKLVHINPLNSNEHNPRQDLNNNENSILDNSGIHLYISTYQTQTTQNPYRQGFQRQPPSIFSLPGEQILISGEGIQFGFQGRPWGPQ